MPNENLSKRAPIMLAPRDATLKISLGFENRRRLVKDARKRVRTTPRSLAIR